LSFAAGLLFYSGDCGVGVHGNLYFVGDKACLTPFFGQGNKEESAMCFVFPNLSLKGKTICLQDAGSFFFAGV